MNRFISVFAVALVLMFPAAAFASVISLSPTNVSVTPGKVFTVRVMVNPEGKTITAVQANILFSPKLVEVTGFKFATIPAWVYPPTPINAKANNTTGVLIRIAALSDGITSPTLFGTITFKAKKAGNAHISIATKSMTLTVANKNTISGTQGSSIVVVAPVVYKKSPKPTSFPKHVVHNKKVSKTSSAKSGLVKAAVASVAATSTATSTVANSASTTQGETAAAAAAVPSTKGSKGSDGSMYLAGALGVFVGLLVWWFTRKRLPAKHQ